MKTKQISMLLATLLIIQNMAYADVLATPIDELRKTVTGKVSKADLDALIGEGESQAIKELGATYLDIRKKIDALKAIQNSNENDFVLSWANKIQVVLIGASVGLVHLHISKGEKATYQLQLAAAASLLNFLFRHYSEIKNLQPAELGVFLTKFNQEMTTAKIMTPELAQMSDDIGNISTTLIQQKNLIDSTVAKLGGGSDAATGVLIVLSIAHWLNPKLAKQAEAFIKETEAIAKKTMTQRAAAGGAGWAKSGKVVGTTTATAGTPDIIGVTLGLDSTKSQEIIAVTLNKLEAVARRIQLQLNQNKVQQ